MKLLQGNCLEEMGKFEKNSVDSIVTDPPYGLSFMGKNWDHGVPGEPFWREALRVAKPGAYLLAFGGTRTFHRLAVAIEDAGWEIRDTVMWVYGSGFPKSQNISKAIDKKKGSERKVVGFDKKKYRPYNTMRGNSEEWSRPWQDDENAKIKRAQITVPTTKEAQQWDGWGTALKPAWEPIILARKPISEKTIAENVLKWGTGAINIDDSRIITNEETRRTKSGGKYDSEKYNAFNSRIHQGRFPANLLHDGSDEVVKLFPVTENSYRPNAVNKNYGHSKNINIGGGKVEKQWGHNDSGSAARFFYCAKASKTDRNEGCDRIEEKTKTNPMNNLPSGKKGNSDKMSRNDNLLHNNHPTVKPTDLMRYLCRLVTPLGGTVFDPFMGSGSTGKAAILEGFDFIGIEMEEEYIEIAKARIDYTKKNKDAIINGAGKKDKKSDKKEENNENFRKLF